MVQLQEATAPDRLKKPETLARSSLAPQPSFIRLLIVEDNEIDVEWVRRALARESSLRYELVRARTLEEAMISLSGPPDIDLVVIDLGLPDAEGPEAVHRIVMANPALPVVVLSGLRDDAVAHQSICAGAQDYLVKGECEPQLFRRALRFATERKSAEQRLKVLASYDSLTGLANRQEFRIQLEKAFSHANRHSECLAVVMFDLDGFKLLNDQHGHAFGDAVLITIANELKDAIRAGDTAGRLGGDEFAVLLEGLPNREHAQIWIERLFQRFERDFEVSGLLHRLRLSAGVAIYPSDSVTLSELMHQSDLALYRAKSEGKGQWRFFDQSLHHAATRRQHLGENLARAIKNYEFVPYYQPQVDLISENVYGVEALCRWRKPDGYVLPPGEFLPLAEASGFISDLDLMMLNQVARDLQKWGKARMPRIQVSVNAHANSVVRRGFAAQYLSILDQLEVDAQLTTLEITESAALVHNNAVQENIEKLDQAGVRISLDDFGVGYSSFSHLRSLPISELKIDRSLVADVCVDSDAKSIVGAVSKLANDLGVNVVAEGVETEEQLLLLNSLGVLNIQGFLLAMPMPEIELINWHKAWQSDLNMHALFFRS